MKEAVLPVETDVAAKIRSTIYDVAEQYIGHPTCSASRRAEGMEPHNGFHCLGLVSQVLRDAQVLPQRADGTVRPARGMGVLYAKSRLVLPEQAERGDLVFYVHTNHDGLVYPSHVGVYAGVDRIIDSSGVDNDLVRRTRIGCDPYPYSTDGNPLEPGVIYSVYRSVVQTPWHFQGKPL